MGALFSFVFRRSDFLTYEKSLEKISVETSKLQLRRSKRKASLLTYKRRLTSACLATLVPCVAWVAYLRQHHEYLSTSVYFTQTATPFLLPAGLYTLALCVHQLLLLVDRHEEKHLRKLGEAKKKLLKELKDSTHFEKTMALLKKYDPEVQAAAVAAARAASPGGVRQCSIKLGHISAASQSLAAGSKVTGNLLQSALDHVGTLATTLIGDNPTLLEELRKAQVTAQKLQQENDALRQQLEQLCRKYDETPVFLAITGPPQQQQQQQLQALVLLPEPGEPSSVSGQSTVVGTAALAAAEQKLGAKSTDASTGSSGRNGTGEEVASVIDKGKDVASVAEAGGAVESKARQRGVKKRESNAMDHDVS